MSQVLLVSGNRGQLANDCRCVSTGRKCDGYTQPSSSGLSAPYELGQSTAIISTKESRALDFFFNTTSYQLAGFLEGDFWRRSVLQLSLSEPSIRQALAALGSLHECEAQSLDTRVGSPDADQLYARAIRSAVDKAGTGESAVPIVVMASILFTSFEFLRRNAAAAATHIANGISILRSWRQSSQTTQDRLCDRKYPSYEAQFLHSELAPILTLFSLNASEFSPFPKNRLILHESKTGVPHMPARFETLREARVALVDLVTASAAFFQRLDVQVGAEQTPNLGFLAPSEDLRVGFDLWKTNFQELLQRRESKWSVEEKSAANVIRIMQYGSEVGLAAYVVSNECEWDSRREEYEEILRVSEALLADSAYEPDGPSKGFNLEVGLIYPMHAVAWKCRYPSIRRRALDLLLRSPRREWLLDSRQYHAIFSRIMAIEEECLGLPPHAVPDDSVLPPEHVRVHEFFCVPQPEIARDPSGYGVTFMTKPEGIQGPWNFTTEYMSLPTVGVGDMAPSNLISCRRWASPDTTDPETAKTLKSTVFGPYHTATG